MMAEYPVEDEQTDPSFEATAGYRPTIRMPELTTEPKRRRRVLRDFSDGVIHLSVSELTMVIVALVFALLGAGGLGGVIGHAIR